MNNVSIPKVILILFIVDYIESITAPILIQAFINIPLTFLVFSFVVYRSNSNPGSIFAFFIGLYVDIISDSPIGLNAMLFCIMSHLINSYSNTFRLFSYFQICLFFSASSLFFIGFKNLFINIENFSYLELITSFIFNSFLLITLSISRFNFLRNISRRWQSNNMKAIKRFFLYLFFLFSSLLVLLFIFIPY